MGRLGFQEGKLNASWRNQGLKKRVRKSGGEIPVGKMSDVLGASLDCLVGDDQPERDRCGCLLNPQLPIHIAIDKGQLGRWVMINVGVSHHKPMKRMLQKGSRRIFKEKVSQGGREVMNLQEVLDDLVRIARKGVSGVRVVLRVKQPEGAAVRPEPPFAGIRGVLDPES